MPFVSRRALHEAEKQLLADKMRKHLRLFVLLLSLCPLLILITVVIPSEQATATAFSLLCLVLGLPLSIRFAIDTWRKRRAVQEDLLEGVADRFEGSARLTGKFAAAIGVTKAANPENAISWFDRLPNSGLILCTDCGPAPLGQRISQSLIAATGHGGYSVPLSDSTPDAPDNLRRRHMSTEEISELVRHVGHLRRERLGITLFTCLYAVYMVRVLKTNTSSMEMVIPLLIIGAAFYNAKTYYEQWKTASALREDIKTACVYIDADKEIEFLASSRLLWVIKDVPAGWRFVVS